MRKEIIDLKDAIVRFSPLIADNLRFPMSPEELQWLYEQIGIHYMSNEEFNKRYSLNKLFNKLGLK